MGIEHNLQFALIITNFWFLNKAKLLKKHSSQSIIITCQSFISNFLCLYSYLKGIFIFSKSTKLTHNCMFRFFKLHMNKHIVHSDESFSKERFHSKRHFKVLKWIHISDVIWLPPTGWGSDSAIHLPLSFQLNFCMSPLNRARGVQLHHGPLCHSLSFKIFTFLVNIVV